MAPLPDPSPGTALADVTRAVEEASGVYCEPWALAEAINDGLDPVTSGDVIDELASMNGMMIAAAAAAVD